MNNSYKRIRLVFAVLCLVLFPVITLADQLELRHVANIYSEADRHSSILEKVDPSDYQSPYLLQLLDNKNVNGYYHVQLPGTDQDGWIYKTFVRRIDSSQVPSGGFVDVSNDPSQPTTLTSSSGRRYKVTDVAGEDEEGIYEDISENDIYTGTDRKDAKTSFPQKSTDGLKIQTLDVVLKTLPTDKFMLTEHKPKITRQSKRVAEENVIVKVKTFIFAAKKEADNDYHLILCSDPQKSPLKYMTAEITGVPEDGPFKEALIKPRSDLKKYLRNQLPGSSYKKYDPPIPVEVTGPLFFDVDHKAGVVGPKGHRPKTAWEIHPVMAIKFLQ